MEAISFKDRDGDVIEFEPAPRDAVIVRIVPNHSKVAMLVRLETVQLLALRDWCNTQVADAVVPRADPDYIKRYEV